MEPTERKHKAASDRSLAGEVSDIAEFIYGRTAAMPPEEQQNVKIKLRGAATDLLYLVNGLDEFALGTIAEREWLAVRKCALRLKAMYRFAGRQRLMEFDPVMMIRLESLLQQLNLVITKINQRTGAAEEEAARKLKAQLQESRTKAKNAT